MSSNKESNYQELEFTIPKLKEGYELHFKNKSLDDFVFCVPLLHFEAESSVNGIYAYDSDLLKNRTVDALKDIEDAFGQKIKYFKVSPVLIKCVIYKKTAWWQKIWGRLTGADEELALDVTIEDYKGKRDVRIRGPITSVGTAKNADLRLFIDPKRDKYVSDIHAQIVCKPTQDQWFVANVSLKQSKNKEESTSKPIFVDGNTEEINTNKPYTVLANDSIIQFGGVHEDTKRFPQRTIQGSINHTQLYTKHRQA